MASARAGSATSTRSDGSIRNEKNKKNVAANRSRSGAIRAAARSSARPDRARPTRKAPIAPDTSIRWANPPTSSVSPNTVSSSDSSEPPATTSLRWPPYRTARTRTKATAVIASPTLPNRPATVPPAINAATTGR